MNRRQLTQRGGRAAAAVILLTLLSFLVCRLASLRPADVVFDVGPTTGAYLEGFTESEERPPVSFRWTTERARVHLPLALFEGSAELKLRYARFLPGTARVHVFLSGVSVARFGARSGRFRTQVIAVPVREGPLELELVVEDPDPDKLGIALDWIALDGARAEPLGGGLPLALALVGWFFALRLAGLGWRAGLAVAFVTGLAAGLCLGQDPFGSVHVASRLALPFLVLTLALAAAVRFFPEPAVSRWLVVTFAAGLLLKGAVLLHPSYFYPDVRNHGRYVLALGEPGGTLVERGVRAQLRVHTAYPRWVSGRAYAFPYSPLPFVPFTWLATDPHLVEEALKLVALVAASLEAVAVFWLAAAIAGPRLGVVASAVAVFLPPMYSRLLLAMWPTVFGHLLDVLVVAAAARWVRRPDSIKATAGVAVATLAALLTYISSLFNVTSFLGFLAILKREIRGRVLLVGAVAVATTVLLLYRSFTLTFLTEILPVVIAGQGAASEESSAGSAWAALGRITLFYGYAYPVLALAGVGWLWHEQRERAVTLVAYALSFGLLVLLRATLGGLFRDLKEILWVGPLVAVGTAASLSALAARGRWERAAAALLCVAPLLFWLGKYVEWFRLYASLAGMAD